MKEIRRADKVVEPDERKDIRGPSEQRLVALKQEGTLSTIERSALRRPFRLVGDFPMMSTVRLQFGEDLGGGSITIQADTNITFIFTPSGVRDIFYIQLKDIHLQFKPFDIPISSAETFRVEGFDVGPGQFDLPAFEGILNAQTKEVALKFVIVLDPEDLPVLAKLGLGEAMRLVAEERGRLDILTGAIDTHAAPFNLGPGLFENVLVMGGQFSGGGGGGGGTTPAPSPTPSPTVCGSPCLCEGPDCPGIGNNHCPARATEAEGCAKAGGSCTKSPGHIGFHGCSHGHAYDVNHF